MAAKTEVIQRKISAEELLEQLKPFLEGYEEELGKKLEDFRVRMRQDVITAIDAPARLPKIHWSTVLQKVAIGLNKAAGSKQPAKSEESSGGKAAQGLARNGGAHSTVPHIPWKDRPLGIRSQSVAIEARGEISKPMMRILKALVELEAIGQNKPTREAVAFWAEASPKSSSFEKNVSSLKTSGLISYPDSGHLSLTNEGRSEAPQAEQLTAAGVFARGLELLSSPEKRIMATLHNAYPSELTRIDLAELAGAAHSSSSFEKNVSALKTAGLLTYPSKGSAKAAEWLFF